MKREEILKKAIEKAVENGWDAENEDWKYVRNIKVNKEGSMICTLFGNKNYLHINEIIFDHSFADAFWGENRNECPDCGSNNIRLYSEGVCPYWCNDCGAKCGCDWGRKMKQKSIIEHKGWEYHIQQLAIAEDRLEYIKGFLK